MGVAAAFVLMGLLMLALGGLGASSASAASTSSPGSATAPSGPVSSNMRSFMQALEGMGLSKTAAAGIVGNLMQESSLNAGAAGGGLAQYQDPTAYGLPANIASQPAGVQLAGIVTSLRSHYPALLAAMNRATSPAQAATLFSQQYERPGVPMLQNRINYANQAFASG